mmetsp:Transcript_56540/g.133560  ORF Transcript_56540/g.133560 Transcript_56540/m.133560 type:complete len:300 (+) Transcript_56540:155-1054(+)
MTRWVSSDASPARRRFSDQLPIPTQAPIGLPTACSRPRTAPAARPTPTAGGLRTLQPPCGLSAPTPLASSSCLHPPSQHLSSSLLNATPSLTETTRYPSGTASSPWEERKKVLSGTTGAPSGDAATRSKAPPRRSRGQAASTSSSRRPRRSPTPTAGKASLLPRGEARNAASPRSSLRARTLTRLTRQSPALTRQSPPPPPTGPPRGGEARWMTSAPRAPRAPTASTRAAPSDSVRPSAGWSRTGVRLPPPVSSPSARSSSSGARARASFRRRARASTSGGGRGLRVQGYLAHKKLPPP